MKGASGSRPFWALWFFERPDLDAPQTAETAVRQSGKRQIDNPEIRVELHLISLTPASPFQTLFSPP